MRVLMARLAYGLLVLGSGALAFTSLPALLGGATPRGWSLMVHMLAAPALIVGMTLAMLLWAERCRFGVSQPDANNVQRVATGQKVLFWAGLLLGFICTTTMLAAMLPAFGYAEQLKLQAAHRYSGLGLVIVLVAHILGMLIVPRRGKGK